MDKKTSIKDIASHVGVSTALVSYVLNGKEKEARVGKEIAVKIRKAATKLKYQPNLIAKSLKSGKTHTIGLIVADISNPFFSNLARIIEDEAKDHGYTVIIGSSDESAEKSQVLIDTLLNRQVDGLIIAPADNTQNQVKALLKNKMPFVLVDRYFPGINTNTVSINNYRAANKVVSHLLQNGYEKIGMLMYETSLFHMHERKRGYLQALKDHKIQSNKNWLMEASYLNIT
ncbi:MAG: LacI family DNA-binding transcriptional regulator, partial [Chitinophagaceae bacterium]